MANSKTTSPKPFCFVLMPFSEEFDDVYRIGIKEACDKAGAYCERVDEQIFSERILDRVYNQIAKADLIVADMSGRNPNVFYEVGYAHALGKLTILLTKNADDIPFDLKHFTHIVYGTKVSVLRDELEKRVKYFIENPPTKLSDTKIGLELFLGNVNLASGKAVYTFRPNILPSPEFTIFNSSSDTYNSGDFKIGILAKRLNRCKNDEVKTTKLPTREYLHMMPDFPTLFPNAYTSYRILLNSSPDSKLKPGEEETILVRLFTKQGNRDFPVIVQRTELS
ncbi:MAG TPA: hypothetical protein VF721_21270 [Pyrinomonadaceae bacterium]|jgi:hypothetical protein